MSRYSKTPIGVTNLETLMIGNTRLQKIESYLNRFNPIKIMGMEHMEIRHSAILSWLLNPQENHGLGDRFLKEFLAKSLRDSEADVGISALQILKSDLHRAEVRREWRNIDLLVVVHETRWVFIIENKFHSTQRSNQLKTYYKGVAAAFPLEKNFLDKDHRRPKGKKLWTAQGIFLSLNDEEPALPEIYTTIRYQDILSSLEQILQTEEEALRPKVFNFITHYVNILREVLGMSEELDQLKELARDLYREHRKVFDFIFEHGQADAFSDACELAFSEGIANKTDDWVFDKIGNSRFGFHKRYSNSCVFLPEPWHEALNLDKYYYHGCEKWHTGIYSPLACWFQLWTVQGTGEGKIRLYAEVGPLSETEFRRELISEIEAATDSKLIAFQSTSKRENAQFSRFLNAKESTKSIDDITDANKIVEAMTSLLNKFDGEFKKIANRLKAFHKYGKKSPLES